MVFWPVLPVAASADTPAVSRPCQAEL